MNISEKLNQEKLLELLVNICNNTEKLGSANTRDLVSELKDQILSVTSKS
jgi:hypothetical protein